MKSLLFSIVSFKMVFRGCFLLIFLSDILKHLLSNERELDSNRKGVIVELGPHFVHFKCPENESHMCTKGVLSGLTMT